MKTKHGISLIMLVITIIVMTILAGAIVLTLNSSNIIDRAVEVVDKSNLATVKELASLGWAEAYADGARTVAKLQEGVEKILKLNNIDTEQYGILVTTNGVKVARGWLQDGLTVRKGKTILEIGDKIAYDETNGGSITGLTETEWAVLGANEKGELLIMSTSSISSGQFQLGSANAVWGKLDSNEERELLKLSTNDRASYSFVASSSVFGGLGSNEETGLLKLSTSDISSYSLDNETIMAATAAQLQESKNDWLTGADQLDERCEPYGKGKGATSVRSIRVEDINKVTGYAPETAKYGEGTLEEYGNEVTYSYNGTTNPAYSGSNGVSGTLSTTHDNFHYYNGVEFVTISDLTTGTNGTSFAKLKSTYYDYYPDTLTESSSGEQKGISKDTKAYKMLFRNSEDTGTTKYWLASPYVKAVSDYVVYGYYEIYISLYSAPLCISTGETSASAAPIRAVVSLASDIKVTGDSTNGWSY